MKRTTPIGEIELSCGCIARYPNPLPTLGEMVWCRACNAYAQRVRLA